MFLLMQANKLVASSGVMSGKNNVVANRFIAFYWISELLENKMKQYNIFY